MKAGRRPKQKKQSDAEAQILKRFGENVRRLRNELELAQDDFGRKSGIHRTYIGAVERGENNLTLLSICRIAKHLGCDPCELLEGLDLNEL